MSKPVVSVAKCATRFETVREALEGVRKDVEPGLLYKKRVLIKPNFVSTSTALSATQADAVRAILDFLQPFEPREVIIGEGPAMGSASAGFRNYGYQPLVKEYGVQLVDLNDDDYVEIPIFDERLRDTYVRVSKTVYEADYRVSAAVMKTHDTVIVTLSLKNMVVGSLVGGQKGRIHQGYAATNLDLYRVAARIPVHLAVLDGFKAMEGDGPVSGTAVDLRVALAGTDFIAVDSVGAYIMGFDPDEVGYLYYADRYGLGVNDLSRIATVGVEPDKVRRRFQPHCRYERQRHWALPENVLRSIDERMRREALTHIIP
ncbi:MAG: DUF362 domain-containing protein [Candidatus Bathyarchaeia archaeon]